MCVGSGIEGEELGIRDADRWSGRWFIQLHRWGLGATCVKWGVPVLLLGEEVLLLWSKVFLFQVLSSLLRCCSGRGCFCEERAKVGRRF